MKKYDELRVKLLSNIGANTGKIRNIPDHMYNRLRYLYHQGLPMSFYLLFEDIPNNGTLLKNIMFTRIFNEMDEYKIVNAELKTLHNHTYIECNDEVFDIDLNMVADKEYYELMFKPEDKQYLSKEQIREFIKVHNIGGSRLEDSFFVPLEVFDSIKEQADNYDSYHKDLIDRQVNSYFKDINYDDGMIIINIK